MVVVRALRRGSHRTARAAALLFFIASAFLTIAAGATSPQSASPRGSSEFYETLDVDTVDDTDEVVGSDGTLRESTPDIHDILELIEDGRIYPVLSKDENQYTPSTSISKDEDFSVTPEVGDEFANDGSKTNFLDFEETNKNRRKRDEGINDGNNLTIKEFDHSLDKQDELDSKPETDVEMKLPHAVFDADEQELITKLKEEKTQNILATLHAKDNLKPIKKYISKAVYSTSNEKNVPKSIIEKKSTGLYSKSKKPSEISYEDIVKLKQIKKNKFTEQDLIKKDAVLENSTKKNNETAKVIEKINNISSKSNLTTEGNNERIKRETSKENKTAKEGVKVKEKRVKTGDTILNIKGAVKDSIGDASPGRSSGASVLDAVVIHPSQYLRDAPSQSDNHTEHTTREAATVTTAGAPGAVGERQLLAEHRSRVRLHCDLPANITVQEWVKDGEAQNIAPGAGLDRPVWWAEGATGAAIVGRAGRGEAGAWRCVGYSAAGDKVFGEPLHLTVYEESRQPYLELDGRRLDPGNTWVPVREGVVLEVLCITEGGVPAPELTWRLVSATGPSGPTELRRHLRASPANYTQPGLSSSVARVTVTRALHNASLECDATQPRPEPRHPHTATARLLIHVTYPPSFVISRWPGFGIALWTGGKAALRCDVDSNPAVRAWWVREPHDAPASSPPPVDAPDAEPHTATLSWTSLALADAGWYRCRARWGDQEYSSIGYYLSVRPASEQPPSSSESPPPSQNVEVPLGGTVQVHCPKGSVGCWSRRVLGVNGSEMWSAAGSARAHGVLGIRGALHQEGGEYRCVGARAEDEQRLRELKRVTLTVVGSATATAIGTSALPSGGWLLSCAVCGRGKRVRWILEQGGAVIHAGQVSPLARASPLEPDAGAPACARAQLELASGGEVWCAVAGAGGGAIAVFPSRGTSPAHHPPRALATAAAAKLSHSPAILVLLLLARCNIT